MITHKISSLLLASGTLLATTAAATLVTVTVENLQSSGGLYFTPLFTGFHDGSYDLFDTGAPASAGLELISELGDPSVLAAEFAAGSPLGLAAVIANPVGPGGVVFDPGATRTITLDLDAINHRYLSLATMVIPSNDTFIGLDDPIALELFDGAGAFLGGSWSFSAGMHAYDAGTETDILADGAAFVAGVDGTLGTLEGVGVAMQSAGSLSDLLGTVVATGATITSIDGPLLRVSIEAIPEPGMIGPMAAMGLLGLLSVRRRR